MFCSSKVLRSGIFDLSKRGYGANRQRTIGRVLTFVNFDHIQVI